MDSVILSVNNDSFFPASSSFSFSSFFWCHFTLDRTSSMGMNGSDDEDVFLSYLTLRKIFSIFHHQV